MDASAISTSPVSYDSKKETWRHTLLLSFQSLGVVYGRLSTAPLYVFESIDRQDLESSDEIHELFSFIFWTLTIIPLLKYVFIVLRADDDGEGGPCSLYSLLCRNARVGLIPCNKSSGKIMNRDEENLLKAKTKSKARNAIEKYKNAHYLLLFLALLGACMIISDAVFTPAISVLSATSGVGRSLAKISVKLFSSDKTKDHVAKVLREYVPIPAACAMLVCLFTLQRHGTNKIGFMFAPIIITWLFFISGFGLYNILHGDIQILHAVSPVYMLRFIKKVDIKHWKLLSSIALCIAGSEAMFADLGHFSKKSIKVTFICFVYPLLLLTYAGQAAFISKNYRSRDVFHLSESIPDKNIQHIFAVLSLFVSAVGSQGTITAGFSIINQCQALNCFPRVKVVHTSERIHGQVYVPDMNWVFMAFSLAATVGLRNTKELGKATGLAVTGGMLVTTCLMSFIISLYWEKSLFISMCFFLFFGTVEGIYLSTNLLNFFRGAWCLIIMVLLFMTIMITWHYGTMKKYNFDLENKVSTEWLTDYSPGLGVSRVPGIGFVYSDIDNGIPSFFSHLIANLPAFHQVLIFVSFKPSPVPYIPESWRFLIGRIGPREYKIYRCIVQHGYRDNVRDTDDFEDSIMSSIREFIVRDEYDSEEMNSLEGNMIVSGSVIEDRNALTQVTEISSGVDSPMSIAIECQRNDLLNVQRKIIQFMLSRNSEMIESVQRELQETMDARESGTTYFLGRSYLLARKDSNFLKKILVMAYVFIDKNSREPPVALKIRNAALLEVSTVYTI